MSLCRVLGATRDDGSRPLLLGALRNDDAQLRRAAARALAELGPARETCEALVTALADEDGLVRAAAAAALGQLGEAEPAVTQGLVVVTGDEDAHARLAAVRALAQVADPQAASVLRSFVRSPDGALALHAVEGLARLRPEPGDEAVFADALGHPDSEVVKAATRALSLRPGDTARMGLGRALGHPRWDVRTLAAEALGERAALDPMALDVLRAGAQTEADPLVLEVFGRILGAGGA